MGFFGKTYLFLKELTRNLLNYLSSKLEYDFSEL